MLINDKWILAVGHQKNKKESEINFLIIKNQNKTKTNSFSQFEIYHCESSLQLAGQSPHLLNPLNASVALI